MKTKSTIPFSLDRFDQPHWTEQERANVQFAIDLMNNTMNERRFDYILSKYGDLNYTQYNRAIPNGISGLMGYVKELTKNLPRLHLQSQTDHGGRRPGNFSRACHPQSQRFWG